MFSFHKRAGLVSFLSLLLLPQFAMAAMELTPEQMAGMAQMGLSPEMIADIMSCEWQKGGQVKMVRRLKTGK